MVRVVYLANIIPWYVVVYITCLMVTNRVAYTAYVTGWAEGSIGVASSIGIYKGVRITSITVFDQWLRLCTEYYNHEQICVCSQCYRHVEFAYAANNTGSSKKKLPGFQNLMQRNPGILFR
jgi:hypothetical protein